MPVDTDLLPSAADAMLQELLDRVFELLSRNEPMRHKLQIFPDDLTPEEKTAEGKLKYFLHVERPNEGVERLKTIMTHFERRQASEGVHKPNEAHMVILLAPIILKVMESARPSMHGMRTCEMSSIFRTDSSTFGRMIMELQELQITKASQAQTLHKIQQLWAGRQG
jgi:hypothetical protein